MAYVGRKPEIGNYRKADSITTSATATYNLLVGGVAVNPNQNQVICSLNGVVQSSGDSYTIASSQITFASALTSSDVIDFILILGDVLDSGTPSDDTVSTAKIQTNAVTNAKMADDAIGVAELSATGTASSSTFLRGDNAWATAGGDLSFGGDTFGADKTVGANDAYAFSLETSGNTAIKMDASGVVSKPLQPSFRAYNNSATSYTGSADLFTSNVTEVHDKNGDFNVSTGVFTAPVDGIYLFTFSLMTTGTTDAAASTFESIIVTSNGQSRALRMCARNDYTMFGSYMKEFCSTTIFLDASDTAKVTAAWGATETLFASSQNSYFFKYVLQIPK